MSTVWSPGCRTKNGRNSGLTYIQLLGRDCIIINDEEIAHELLGQRSSIYSDRLVTSLTKTFGIGWDTMSLPYSIEWREHRKIYDKVFNRKGSLQYIPTQIQKVHQLLQSLLTAPQDYSEHVKMLSAATVMSIIYGYDVTPKDDPFVSMIRRLLDMLVLLTPERVAILEHIPFSYIPSWFPWGQYKQLASKSRALAKQILDEPFQYSKNAITAGLAMKSLVHVMLLSEEDTGVHHENVVKAVGATGYFAGAETTFSVLLVFILAMVMHPEVQAKAHEEIDRVVGQDRLPDFSDRGNLPYVEGAFLETLRWKPVIPLVTRLTTENDVFDNMYIPKGALVTANVWAMMQDERRFPNPAAFIPERHIMPGGKFVDASGSPVFGFGRRICPGRYVGIQTVWMAIVSVLATFQINKAKDSHGREIDVQPEFTSGITSHPKPFPCEIVPRSSKAENLLRVMDNDIINDAK